MKRREFIALLGNAAAWPLAARAQQAAMPVIGFLSSLSANDASRITAAFYQGLNETGYVDGRNVAVEFRWTDGQYDRLPAMAAELVNRQVAVIAAISGTPAGLAAKSATTSIPIVFAIGGDPVAPGLVTSLNRPAGNVTGVTFFTSPLAAKRLELLRDLVPKATTFAVLTNPDNPPSLMEGIEVPAAAKAFGQEATVFNATSETDIDDAFSAIAQQSIGALFVSADPLFFNYRDKVVALAERHRTPATYAYREQVEAGGLISYGASRSDAYRQAGRYVGRILKGETPGSLPVVLPTKFELVFNLKTAKALGLEVPVHLQQLADEVIE
jgi:putative tryptophan/tyrosine transport system substrate-binding protein